MLTLVCAECPLSAVGKYPLTANLLHLGEVGQNPRVISGMDVDVKQMKEDDGTQLVAP